MTFRRTCTSVLVIGALLVGCGDIETRDVGREPARPAPQAAPVSRPAPSSSSTTASTTTATTTPTVLSVLRSLDYHSWPDWPQWQQLGRCEQPGPGTDGIWWNRPGRYPGGLGILAAAWSENNAGMPARGDLASPAQQIIVGRRIRDRYGWSAWACARSFAW